MGSPHREAYEDAMDKNLGFKIITDLIKDLPVVPKKKVIFTGFIKVTPGKRHAWCETDLGYPIRKELGNFHISG